jgi:hypothetical protein
MRATASASFLLINNLIGLRPFGTWVIGEGSPTAHRAGFMPERPCATRIAAGPVPDLVRPDC